MVPKYSSYSFEIRVNIMETNMDLYISLGAVAFLLGLAILRILWEVFKLAIKLTIVAIIIAIFLGISYTGYRVYDLFSDKPKQLINQLAQSDQAKELVKVKAELEKLKKEKK